MGASNGDIDELVGKGNGLVFGNLAVVVGVQGDGPGQDIDSLPREVQVEVVVQTTTVFLQSKPSLGFFKADLELFGGDCNGAVLEGECGFDETR